MFLSVITAIITCLGVTVGLAGVILANRATTQQQDAVERAAERAAKEEVICPSESVFLRGQEY